MLLGAVVGTVVSTRKDEALTGMKFLAVEELDRSLKPTGRQVVAVDAVGAGPGELVLYASGSSARLTKLTHERAVDCVIMAIVDRIDTLEESVYVKHSASQED
ncbi:MAG: EutN/CcmL family microcompartment protein [Candidatus Eisenbacteria bacterium]|uniref:EutN/CcmL family microcompartment protein n=1 Tax=Eiseniibacteriota bacterium TaxID=2212470 RepID=A0A948RTM0_UNCEI|nr:EutN/CcmL family microcompartment protein [Candidatus Eisenbacteria bacterium]MBU1951183.1 EutN/CcmL family microcompartment protein [Candidatus Eisenbacteria bacterium]MBU2690321.1 EutN/CcmL family microcompartment protein [Candidatus Eisenbacteria bacterium]